MTTELEAALGLINLGQHTIARPRDRYGARVVRAFEEDGTFVVETADGGRTTVAAGYEQFRLFETGAVQVFLSLDDDRAVLELAADRITVEFIDTLAAANASLGREPRANDGLEARA